MIANKLGRDAAYSGNMAIGETGAGPPLDLLGSRESPGPLALEEEYRLRQGFPVIRVAVDATDHRGPDKEQEEPRRGCR